MRRTTTALLTLVLLGGLPTGAHALEEDDAREDDRWLPWIGCWEGVAEEADEELVVCVSFLDEGEGAELVTYHDGEIVSREAIRTDGTPAAIEEGGCEGERFAQWSDDGRRLFLTSEMRCGEGVTRSTRGVMSFRPDGRSWVEIHGVEAGGDPPFVGAQTFVPASPDRLAELGIARPGADLDLAVSTARSHAAGTPDADALVESVDAVGSSVTAAFLVERGEPLGLDAEAARTLAERGVSGDVLDVMVALDHPDRFEIAGDARELRAQALEPEPAPRATERAVEPWPGVGARSRSAWGPYGRFGYGRFGFDPFFHDPFYGPYYSSRVGSGFYRTPGVIFVGSPTVRDRTVVDPQRGYSTSQDTGRRATPSTGRSSEPSTSRSPGASSPDRPEGRTSGGETRVSPSGGYSGDSDGDRRARPRDRDDD